jgi:hypothetical protein
MQACSPLPEVSIEIRNRPADEQAAVRIRGVGRILAEDENRNNLPRLLHGMPESRMIIHADRPPHPDENSPVFSCGDHCVYCRLSRSLRARSPSRSRDSDSGKFSSAESASAVWRQRWIACLSPGPWKDTQANGINIPISAE